jgi:hypothetical protein
MLFHVLFAMASVDAFLNGPQLSSPQPLVLLFLSAAAVAVSMAHPLGWFALVAAQLLWIAAFVGSIFQVRKAKLVCQLYLLFLEYFTIIIETILPRPNKVGAFPQERG